MNTYRNSIFKPFLVLTLLLSLTSCTEDWLNSRIGRIIGGWRVVEVSGQSSYRSGDTWRFYANGEFYAEGYPDLVETGEWDSRGREVQISFDGYSTDISAYVRQIDNDYLVLDVTDYTYSTRYTLRFVRSTMYYSPKKNNE